MIAIQSYTFIYYALLSALLLWSITKYFFKPKVHKHSPPSPPKLPILGNLHQIGSLPHRNLRSLAQKYGPLMLLHFGNVPVLIASTADTASEIMKTHDATFASRPQYKATKKILYDAKNTSFSPYGDHWRKLKSTLVHQLLSRKKVQSFRPIRENETTLLVKRIGESEGAVNLTEMFGEFSNDLICRAAFGCKSRELGNEMILELFVDMMELVGSITIGDFIPWLGWIDWISGFDGKMCRVAKEMDEFLEDVIKRRVESRKENAVVERDGHNFLDLLLKMHEENGDGDSIGRDVVKILILDTIAGATDTVFTSLEWAMTELLQHPIVMEKLQDEVREIVENKEKISDDDLEKMQYMKAVIKETFRLHPPAALGAPRVAGEDVNIKGYDISKGTVVMVNIWAIGRDPASWDEPEKFMPERFLNSSTGYNSMDFRWIPFGAGRRACPGMTYSMPIIELVLANLLQKFDWKLPDGVVLDMTDCAGLATHKAIPLVAIASKNA